MTDKLRGALELIKALDVPVNIVDVMDSTAREAVEIAKAALAQQDAQSVLPGYMLVPVEPTDEMCAEGLEDEGHTIVDGKSFARALYSAMLNAAPTPPAQQDVQAVPPKVWPDVKLPKPELLVWRGGKLHGAGFSAKQVRKCAKDYALAMLNARPQPQQDAQAVPQGWREFLKEIEWANSDFNAAGDAEPYCVCCDAWQSQGHKPDCKFMAMLNAAPTPPAQQDAQSLVEAIRAEPTEMIHKWRVLELIQAHDPTQTAQHGFDWSKFPGNLIDHYEGEVLTEELLQRAAADLCAAPTPPAQRVMLTDEEVLDLWSPGLRRPALGVKKVETFARDVIEAYERKNAQLNAEAVVAMQNPQPDPERLKLMLARLISQAERIGALLERCQGKGWPQAESDEFTRLRDVHLPGTLLAIEQMFVEGR